MLCGLCALPWTSCFTVDFVHTSGYVNIEAKYDVEGDTERHVENEKGQEIEENILLRKLQA